MKDIAQLYQKNENDVKVILHRARKKLGKMLKGDDDALEVKRELEKYIAIEAFLLEEDDVYDEPKETESNAFSQKLKKNVNRRLLYVSASIALIVTLFIFTTLYVAPKIGNLFYYRPNHVSFSTGQTDVFFDHKAYTRLTQPGFESSFVHAKSVGYGEYTIDNVFHDQFLQNAYAQTGIIKENSVLLTNPRVAQNLPGISEYHNDSNEFVNKEIYMYGQKHMMLAYLNHLSPVAYTSTYLTFDAPLTLDAFEVLKEKYEHIEFAWIAIQTKASYDTSEVVLGFNPAPKVSYGSDILMDHYPYFELNDWIRNNMVTLAKQENSMSEAYIAHFEAMLNYIIDRGDDFIIGKQSGLSAAHAKEALAYTHSHGHQVIGMLVNSEVNDLVRFVEDNAFVDAVYLERVTPIVPNIMYRKIKE